EDESSLNRSSVSDFGDDSFAIGSWERKEITSRDGQLKLQAEVFFASIDQRTLVAVIADWFQNNHDLMPIKSQFDSLIRDGSLEWRNLCENVTYRERFPDRHFDLETVLQAKEAMSFDSIWDEINAAGCTSNSEPQLYIISWNDHFFILKVEPEAYYIIDTLGERLFEGCNQAYILKFDRSTTIHRMPDIVAPPSDENASKVAPTSRALVTKTEEEVVCQGKDSCKEYIKTFLAAIPIRELQTDIKRGLMATTPLHQRLQIEFHYTQCLPPPTLELTIATQPESPAATMAVTEKVAV
ncbi:hypothetical protein LINPERPRIM_LOCUS16424, partial [Linum perenne]